MNDEQLKQRIAYLVEHGGICDDPLVEIRANIRRLYWLGAVVTFALVLDIALRTVL
jgi:hypothetical protein